MKIKKLCDLGKKDIEKHVETLARILWSPSHVCRDCCRVALGKKHLCKPLKLPEAPPHEPAVEHDSEARGG